jgi:hypothetical protein
VCDQETSKTRRLKARYRAVKIQPRWVVTSGKLTKKETKINRLEWTGHLVRMDRGRAVKKVCASKPEGQRRME